jgi:hypothetical protein
MDLDFFFKKTHESRRRTIWEKERDQQERGGAVLE